MSRHMISRLDAAARTALREEIVQRIKLADEVLASARITDPEVARQVRESLLAGATFVIDEVRDARTVASEAPAARRDALPFLLRVSGARGTDTRLVALGLRYKDGDFLASFTHQTEADAVAAKARALNNAWKVTIEPPQGGSQP